MERILDPLAKKGMRIRMQMMDDERPISSGMEGTIKHIDGIGTLHVKWDNGRTMGVVPEIDEYELLPPEEDQIDLDFFEDSGEKLMKKISKNPISSSVDKTFKKAYTKNNLKVESGKESLDEALTLFHFTVPKDQHGINKMAIKAKNREEAEEIISKKYGEGEWE